MSKLLGIVRSKKFVELMETGVQHRLTTIAPQMAVSPESGELPLDTLEGKIMTVHGLDQGEWIYSAQIESAQYFRANVGVVLINQQGEVMKVERFPEGSGNWQMPQGGLDELEDPQHAALRELNEELGLEPTHVQFLQEHPEWLAYELPLEARKAKHGRGQVQKWFLARFVGSEQEIRLDKWAREHGGEQEFGHWEWTTLSSLAEETWEVRRPLYRKLAAEFQAYLQPISKKK